MLKILFMGTPDFAKESLEVLHKYGHKIIGVVTNPDKPKGRGMKMIASPVKEYAIQNELDVYQPNCIKNNTEFTNKIKELNPDIICVVAYGKILPKEVLDIPQLGCINLHGSILPKYRGAAPIQWAVINGDKTTGVTTIYMNEQMDAGDIILKQEVEIGQDETTGELWNKLSTIGAQLLLQTVNKIEQKKAPRTKQESDYTLAPMLSKQMSKIEWTKMTSTQIKNLVRGLDPIMGAYSTYEGKKLKFWKVDILKDLHQELLIDEAKEGQILLAEDKIGLYIKTIDGVISVLQIQAENAKRMNICDFLRGNKLEKGKILI